MKLKEVPGLLVSILICLLAGVFGSVFTYPEIPGWYAGLVKPVFNPPNWIFGPVWTTLYILMGIAAFLVWQKRSENKETENVLAVFGIQLVINSVWSLVFFGYHALFLGLVIIAVLWALILTNIIQFYKISKPAGWILVPYILWVSFASVLNLAIWIINR